MDPTIAFEVRSADGKAYRIWADGRTEGFGERCIVINRIPHHISQAVAAALTERPAAQ